ncbi:MAG: copper resistance system multicopper oxidase [Alphaproteobacteria bacterium]|nr:copper resistance system multicopper oxidase [Alphaproteobacteria bacterium]
MFYRVFISIFVILVSLASVHAGEYRLTIDRQPVNVTGKPVQSLTINGQVPGPTLRFKEGEDVTIHVTNRLREDASMHWHGLLLPGQMDGVPGLNGYPGIKPGGTYTYRFKIRQAGTYWYHSHSGTQEQAGLYGPLIIDPATPDVVQAGRDYVVVLSDFTEEDSDEILRNLKNDAGYYNYGKRTLSDFFADARRDGFWGALRDRLDWGDMRMDPTDLSDVSGYTFLVNGKSAAQNWTGLFKPGERVRLRFINASAMSYFDVHIPGLKMIVIQADGQNVQPVPVDEFRIAVAETYDVIVVPKDMAYTIMAEPIDRSGYARGTLAPREGMSAPIPPLRPRSVLNMSDMGMAHGMNDMPGMDGVKDMDHGADGMSGTDHSSMSGTDHGAKSAQPSSGSPRGWADAGTPPGMKALRYADLKSLVPQKDTRPAAREIVVHLGGNMERYIWTLNGRKANEADPIELHHGERVKLTFVNESMMAHPMHLHGMFVQLVNGQPADRLPNKHVVNVAPGSSYSVMLTADEPGEWAFHCHLLYHMNAGMMTKVVVARMSAEAAR